MFVLVELRSWGMRMEWMAIAQQKMHSLMG